MGSSFRFFVFSGLSGVLFWMACGPLLPSKGVEHWPLIGAHEAASCEACHGDTLGPLSSVCASCHIEDRPPAHYEGPCEECHTPMGWMENAVDHSFFPLEESHDVDCTSCHGEDGLFTGLDPACTSCHTEDRPTPEHHLGQECGECHNIISWSDIVVDHSFFPLEESHDVDCTSCHGESGDFTGLDPACTACHAQDRPTPNHNLGKECGECHNTIDWWDIVVDHSFFPLEEGHDEDCASCHGESGDYTGLDSSCTSCHTDDRPSSSHFLGKECDECHSTTTWEGLEHDHDCKIPHEGNGDCADCHPDSTDTFVCTNCHEHRKSEADKEHKDESGYQWTSTACLDCHPKCKD